jgi:dTMP kinase
VSLFVTFEGPEGAGKSTQVQMVANLLRDSGNAVLETREPGGTALGERIRDLLLAQNDYEIAPRTEALLMTAARAQHVTDVITPALSNGQIVLCDRFIDSTLAYQGAGRGLPVDELISLQSFAVGSIRPDLSVLLDLPVAIGIERRRQSGTPLNRLDQDEVAFHERVRTWYVRSAQEDPARWLVLDAQQQPEVLCRQIGDRVLEMIASGTAVTPRDGNAG